MTTYQPTDRRSETLSRNARPRNSSHDRHVARTNNTPESFRPGHRVALQHPDTKEWSVRGYIIDQVAPRSYDVDVIWHCSTKEQMSHTYASFTTPRRPQRTPHRRRHRSSNNKTKKRKKQNRYLTQNLNVIQIMTVGTRPLFHMDLARIVMKMIITQPRGRVAGWCATAIPRTTMNFKLSVYPNWMNTRDSVPPQISTFSTFYSFMYIVLRS